MSTLRISNIEAKSVPASATIDEKVKITNSFGDTLVFLDGKTSGITTVGINTTDGNITFDANSNVVVTGIITATRFSGQITPTSLEIGSNIKLGNAGVITATSFVGSGAQLTGITSPAITSIANDAVSRVLTTDGDGTATAHSEVKIETVSGNKRLSINRGTGSTEVPLLVRRTDASGIVAEFSNSGGYGVYIGQNGATGEGYIRTATGQPLVFTTNSGSGLANERLRIDSSGQFSLGRTNQITANGNSSTSVFEQLSNSNYPLALHSSQTNKRGLAIFYATTGAGNAGDPFIVCTDNTNNKFQVTSDGSTTIRGNLVIATAGKGIDFSATANAGSPSSTSSELFDDYEEGSWVPGLSGSSSVTGQTYSSRSGYYTKIGNRVFCDFSIVIGTKGSYGGTYIQIVNLPFTVNGGAYTRSCSTPIYFRTLNYRWCFLGLQQHEGQSKCYIFGVEGPGSGTDGASNRSYPDGGDIANGTEFTCSFSYLAA